MQYQLTVKVMIEERHENGEYGSGHLAAEETICLGSLDLAQLGDILAGFHDVAAELKVTEAEILEEKSQ